MAPYHGRVGYTAYHVKRQDVDYVSNNTVHDYTVTSVCHDWTRRMNVWGCGADAT